MRICVIKDGLSNEFVVVVVERGRVVNNMADPSYHLQENLCN